MEKFFLVTKCDESATLGFSARQFLKNFGIELAFRLAKASVKGFVRERTAAGPTEKALVAGLVREAKEKPGFNDWVPGFGQRGKY